MTVKEKDAAFIADTYGRFDLQITHGHGSVVYDEAGRAYIDMATGIAVNTLGVADEGWVRAVSAQLACVQHTSNLYYNAPSAELAERLCLRTGASRVFFANSGAEANECAIKVARKWAQDTKGAGDYTVVTLKNSFHGRTIATLKATGQDVFHTNFNPFPEGFCYAEAGSLASVRDAVDTHACCAVMLELVQGEGGVVPLDPAFVRGVVDLCRERELLLIVDEVQTGNGRTGELYAYMAYGLTPDVVTTAKGLGGGLPIGAALLFDRVAGTLTRGTHGSTFGANPAVCAGASYVLDAIDDALLAGVRERSAYVFRELRGAKGITDVCGMGLMIGIETEGNVDEIVKYCMQNGVLPIKAKTRLRLLPALNIPMELLERAVGVIKEAAARYAK